MRLWQFFVVVLLALAPSVAWAMPPMWLVKDDDTTIYLFGTVHVLKPGTQWLSEELETAIVRSDKLYLEISAAEQADTAATMGLVQQYGMLPPGEALADHLPAKDAARLKEALASVGLPAMVSDRFKPWFAATTYSAMRFMQLGYNPASGVEAALAALAAEKGVPADGLETMAYQLNLFDSMSDEDVVLFIRDLLDSEAELSDTMDTVTVSWTQGDLSALDEEMNDMADLSPTLADLLIYGRNETWAEEIEELMEEPGQFTIAVGSGHFVGERSVISYLRQAGFTVERVQ